MSFVPIRDIEGRSKIRFEFDGERGRIRHRSRDGREQEYQIVPTERGYDLQPIKPSVRKVVDR